MKTRYLISLIMAMAMLASFSAIAVNPAESDGIFPTDKTVVSETADKQKVLETRFLNMLNHSFAYGEELASAEDLVNCAVTALCVMNGGANGSFIEESRVEDYLYNMYGVEVENLSSVNADFPKKDGYVYIIPRGYTVYKHEVASVRLNEDGSYTVTTNVTIDSHDSREEGKAVTLFVRNNNSQFGFNIISSEIISDAFEA